MIANALPAPSSNTLQLYAAEARQWTIAQLGNDKWAVLAFEGLIIAVVGFIGLYAALGSCRAVFGSISGVFDVIKGIVDVFGGIVEAMQRVGVRLIKAIVLAFIAYAAISVALTAQQRMFEGEGEATVQEALKQGEQLVQNTTVVWRIYDWMRSAAASRPR